MKLGREDHIELIFSLLLRCLIKVTRGNKSSKFQASPNHSVGLQTINRTKVGWNSLHFSTPGIIFIQKAIIQNLY